MRTWAPSVQASKKARLSKFSEPAPAILPSPQPPRKNRRIARRFVASWTVSVLPGNYGIEAGQSAVGDMFLWFVNNLVPDKYGATMDEKFQNMEAELSKLKPGETGLLALDWNNGNRTILVDVRLSGLLLGQTLHTQAHEIYRALIEATAFGALTIIKRMEEYGVHIDEVVNTGGLSVKNPTLMQIYADILGRPLKVAKSDQTCALGAAIFGAAASGQITIKEAQSGVCGYSGTHLHARSG